MLSNTKAELKKKAFIKKTCNTVTGYPFKVQFSYHIETSQLICRANQLTGFYMMGTLVVKGL